MLPALLWRNKGLFNPSVLDCQLNLSLCASASTQDENGVIGLLAPLKGGEQLESSSGSAFPVELQLDVPVVKIASGESQRPGLHITLNHGFFNRELSFRQSNKP